MLGEGANSILIVEVLKCVTECVCHNRTAEGMSNRVI